MYHPNASLQQPILSTYSIVPGEKHNSSFAASPCGSQEGPSSKLAKRFCRRVPFYFILELQRRKAEPVVYNLKPPLNVLPHGTWNVPMLRTHAVTSYRRWQEARNSATTFLGRLSGQQSFSILHIKFPSTHSFSERIRFPRYFNMTYTARASTPYL